MAAKDVRFGGDARAQQHRDEDHPGAGGDARGEAEHAGAGDPPIYLSYPAAPALGQDQKDPTHTANFGVKLQERLRDAGVPCELAYPGAPDVRHPEIADFLIATLRAPR